MYPWEPEVMNQRLEGMLVGDDLKPEALERIIHQSLSGNESDDWQLFANFFPHFFKMLRMKHLSNAKAHELAWKCCLKLKDKLAVYEAKRRSSESPEYFFNNWAFSVAWSTYYDWLRIQPKSFADEVWADLSLHVKKARPVDDEKLLDGNELHWCPSGNDYSKAIAEALCHVSEPYRTIFLLRYGYGWTQDELAERFGIGVGSVRTYCHRAKNVLEKKLAHSDLCGWFDRNRSFIERCHGTIEQAHTLRQLQAANRRDTFLPISMQCLLEQLADIAKITLQPLLDWWELDFTFRKPTAVAAWAEFAKVLGVESYKAELYGRISLAQQANPGGWKMAAANFRCGMDEHAALQACDIELQQLEHVYLDHETRILCQLKAAVRQVYGETTDSAN
jgi:RNA polymerase sigma factor (sigma-70 family)